MNAESYTDWLDSWGEGPNWSDATGATIPIAKESLRALLCDYHLLVDKLRDLHDRVDLTDPNDPVGTALTQVGLKVRP